MLHQFILRLFVLGDVTSRAMVIISSTLSIPAARWVFHFQLKYLQIIPVTLELQVLTYALLR